MLKRSVTINIFIMLATISLVDIYSSEDFSVQTNANVELANAIFKEELQKSAKDLLEGKNITETQKIFVKDSTVLRYLMYIRYRLIAMDNQAKQKYEDNFYAYSWYLDKLKLDVKEAFGEFDEEFDNLEKLLLKEPDFLLSQELIPIKNSAGQNFLLSRRFLQQIPKGKLTKKIIIEENNRYFEKKPKERLVKIKNILAQYRSYFKNPQNEFMKKAKRWGPKTRDESLLAREIMYSLFEMVRTDDKDFTFPFKSARKYGKSRFNFAIEDEDTIALPAQ